MRRCPTCNSIDPKVQRVRGTGRRYCDDQWHKIDGAGARSPEAPKVEATPAPSPLGALADRLERLLALDDADLRRAARILRAVDAAPGDLRNWCYWLPAPVAVDRWFAALADAVEGDQ